MTGNRIKWQTIIEKVKDILVYYESEGVKATLRAVFYRLVSDNSLPNTVSSYQGLSRHLVKARKEGVIDFDAMEDRGRYTIENFGDSHLHRENLEEIQTECKQRINVLNLDTVINDYFNYESIHLKSPLNGYWAKQPIIPEIWVEKDAIAPTIENWTSGLCTSIRVNRGYGGWSFMSTNIQSIKEILTEHDKVAILYIGDLDPSGLDMDRHLKNMIEHFDMSNRIEFKRLALLKEQVEQYNLPSKPEDAETLAKIARDPRSKKYDLNYIVEVDAFLGLAPDAFKNLLQSSIGLYYNEDIADEVAEENSDIVAECRRIRNDAKEQAKEVLLDYILGGGGYD
jgi:hypothetical protein